MYVVVVFIDIFVSLSAAIVDNIAFGTEMVVYIVAELAVVVSAGLVELLTIEEFKL